MKILFCQYNCRNSLEIRNNIRPIVAQMQGRGRADMDFILVNGKLVEFQGKNRLDHDEFLVVK
jgi:hypothetical protein